MEGNIEKNNEKVERLFGHCFEISKLEEGDQIPVGGESVFANETNIKVNGDFEKFKEFFTETHDLARAFDKPQLKEWLNSQGIEFDENVFAKLFAFTKKIEEKYPVNQERVETRRKLYNEKSQEIKLSDIFEVNSPECAEIAALAQAFLQQEEIASTYFSGDVLWFRDTEFSEPHTFIIIQQDGKEYIYDPTNPTSTTSGNFPSIYTQVNFEEEMRRGRKIFVTAKNLLSKKEAFYGVNDGTNVWSEKHII